MTIANSIRQALDRPTGPEALSLNELVEQIGDTGIEREQIVKQLSAMKKTGEVVVSVYEGSCIYGLAEGYEPKRRRKDTPVRAPSAAKPPRRGKRTKAMPVPAGPKAPKPAAPAPAVAAAAVPFGLRDRLAVIAQDLEDAVGDACDARIDHQALKALVVASGAAHRALRQLPAGA